MTDIEAKAEEYAKGRLKYYPDTRILRDDMSALIAEAYGQGWIDRDTGAANPKRRRYSE